MNKKILTFIIMGFILAFSLTGCTQKSDSQNAYKLPLGDAGYIAEMDFPLYKNNTEYAKDSDGNVTDTLVYDYSSNSYAVTISTKVTNESYTDKSYKLSVGYYSSTDEFDNPSEFKELCEAQYGKTVYSEDWKLDNYTFDASSVTLTEEMKNTLVLKLSFGTEVDEEYYKANNEGAKTSAVNKYRKSFRGASFLINGITVNSNPVLTETTTNGTVITKVNTDLCYYNTATVATAESGTITLTLNSKTGAWQWIIGILGEFLYWITNLVGGYYWLGLLIFTLLIRTLAWPIYAKTNSYSSGMSKVQPEIEKINRKYEGKTDQNSKMKQQMEMREVMKKNHVSMWGCLLPFLQMPIFLAVYQVVQRFPLTPMYDSVNYKFLWTTFGMNYGTATGHWSLAVAVGVTMIGSQLLSTYMTQRIQRKTANFYTAKNKQNNSQMLIMMVVMTAMMVMFSWSSSGIAFYWVIGNVYQIAQTFVSKIQEEKKEEKERLASGRTKGR